VLHGIGNHVEAFTRGGKFGVVSFRSIGSSTSPNVTINWTPGELRIAEGTYDLVVAARDGASKDRVFRPGNPPQLRVVSTPTISEN
jgi:hypothetical protein